MKSRNFWWLAVLAALVLSLGVSACGGDDDDDDDDDDDAADDDFADDDATDDDGADDDVDDDADDDDDTGTGDGVPELLFGTSGSSKRSSWMITSSDPELEYWDEWSGNAFNPDWELAAYWVGWRDTDNDLKGGTQYVSLDDGEPVETTIPQSVGATGQWDTRRIGLELEGDFIALGSHQMKIWVVDSSGNESNVVTVNYTVGETTYGLGAQFEDFTLRGFKANPVTADSTGTFADYTLSDYLGKVVLVDSFAGWCPPCESEATELDGIAETYAADLQIFSFMIDTLEGTPVADADLEGWTLYEYGEYWEESAARDEQLMGVILNDQDASVTGPYYLEGYVPNNFLLDRDHVVRWKMNGFYAPYITDIIDYLIAE